jgi:hypothetical protein
MRVSGRDGADHPSTGVPYLVSSYRDPTTVTPSGRMSSALNVAWDMSP